MTTLHNDDFPFDVVIVTSPDEAAARAAPLGSLNVPTKVLSTSDPFDVRCGSGGGTLAALNEEACAKDCTILIVHAGGQSSRCPTQMALGKAWTSLPLLTEIGNPTSILIHSLARLLCGIPKGSVVVAASDVLLNLDASTCQNNIDWNLYSVVGLAVPAPIETATNHGVFVFGKGDKQSNVMAVERFLQKPKLDTLRDDSLEVNKEECAWVDTGVVIFLPSAAATLHELGTGLLKCCTKQGLIDLYNQQQQQGAQSIHEFCQETALKVDLYSHIMLAFTTIKDDGMNVYLDKHKNDGIPLNVLTEMYTALSHYKLHALVVPRGQFIHLGTTQELVDFMSYSVTCGEKTQDANERRCRDFGERIQMVRRSACAIFGLNVDPSCIVLNSMLQCDANNDCIVERGTVVEHGSLVSTTSVKIGSNCLVSGVRGKGALEMPSDTCLQVLPLKTQQEYYVYMYFGVNDDIKGCNVLYGMNIGDVMQWSRLAPHEIWDTSINRSIWNAKLHPVVKHKDDEFQHQALFSWVTTLRQQEQHDMVAGDINMLGSKAMRSLELWKRTKRLSLAEIREMADAHAEFRYRNDLATNIKEKRRMICCEIQKVLMDRKHEECNLQHVVGNFATNKRITQEFWEVLVALDEVAREGLKRAQYDVSSRAFMVMSALLRDMSDALEQQDYCNDEDEGLAAFVDETEVATAIKLLRSQSATNEQRVMACDRLVFNRDGLLKEEYPAHVSAPAFRHCARMLENAGLALIELCVSGPAVRALDKYRQRTLPAAPLDAWVVASSPVRIDLAGGWSDTPPLSYEYGGAVSGLAVTVDGRKPLSSRCRLVSGGRGLVLRTESRDISGKFLSQIEARVHSVDGLADYNNPRADCALIKCALAVFGLVPIDLLQGCEKEELQPYINKFCGSDVNVGMEIVTTSLLPHGSGMGTSSILGGCVLAAVGRCVGVDILGPNSKDDNSSNGSLIQAVLTLEQLLSTGGGWQDQVGGLIGGFKLGTSEAHTLPLSIKVQHVPIDPHVNTELDKRLILLYTGKTRIAKNILQNVLRRWARRSADIVKTVESLVAGARAAADAVQEGNLDELGRCLNEYWQQKKTMAGNDSGAEPAVVQQILTELLERKYIMI